MAYDTRTGKRNCVIEMNVGTYELLGDEDITKWNNWITITRLFLH